MSSRQLPPRIGVALVRDPSPRMCDALRMEEPSTPFSFDDYCREHDEYVAVLRELVPRVITVPGSADLPDCVFIEDTAVICGSTALITRPGHDARWREIDAVHDALQALVSRGDAAGLHIVRAEDLVQGARLDGGDVCATPSAHGDIYVGLSHRTNSAGVEAVRRAFGRPTYAIPVAGALHLKSLLSVPVPGVYVVAASSGGDAVRAAVCNAARDTAGGAVWIRVEPCAANVLCVNGTLLATADTSAATQHELARVTGLTVRTLNNTEGAKVDGALTCGSLLVPLDR